MKITLLKLILASTASLASARVGDPDNQDQGLRQVQGCGGNRDRCTFLTNACCSGFSCHIDGECHRYPRQDGDPCLPWMAQCASGLTCDVTDMECRAMGTAQGDRCNFSRPCAAGTSLSCDFRENKCMLPGALNQYCHSSRPCGVGLECQVSTQSCRYPSLENQSCSLTESCVAGLNCDLTSMICRGPSGLGGTCHLSRTCINGLHCDLDSQTCKNAVGVGGTCDTYVPCADGLWCDGATDTCEVKPSPCELEGEGCDDKQAQNTVGVKPAGGNGGEGVVCNMATGGCTGAPSLVPSQLPTQAPTLSLVPSGAPSLEPSDAPVTPAPTYESMQKCDLSNPDCADMDKLPVDAPGVPEVPDGRYGDEGIVPVDDEDDLDTPYAGGQGEPLVRKGRKGPKGVSSGPGEGQGPPLARGKKGSRGATGGPQYATEP
ncbi:multiple epidermal growth factor-like domains protein [Seminavis robusta]|uniref:Multiple epidermal growth factor-like domains protein n=1 Tax=Seminavis robusta TaxID=568900 RepID=A0A9N8H767_9STRA|nr:multiple epidermal growth factor-like domains protein [Seminavis robusta]|eukprot:Sro132_g062720.1 multiple epidermal growth factor-like domains protein (432) ;mRNA; r:82037-83415